MSETLFVSAEATQQVLTWPEMIECLRQAYSVELASGCNPPRTVASGDGNWLRALTSVPPTGRFMGTKVFGLSRELAVNYLITLFDQNTGKITGLIDGYYITALRTGATSALAIDLMAQPGPVSVCVLGSGTEAQSHLRATAAVRSLRDVRVFSPTQANRDRFSRELQGEFGAPIVSVASAQEAVEGCEIVIGATNAQGGAPVLRGDWLASGSMVVAVGSTMPRQLEIDPRTIERCDLIVCDAIEEVVDETGDFIGAREAGVKFADKLASLNDLVRGNLQNQLSKTDITMFKSVGSAIQDMAVSEMAFNRAVEQGLATPLPIEFLVKRA